LIGLAFAGAYYRAMVAAGEPPSVAMALKYQFLRFQLFAAMAPLIIGLDVVVRRRVTGWPALAACHVGGALLAGVTHTVLFFGALDLLTGQQWMWQKVSANGPSNIVTAIVIYEWILGFNYAIEYYDKYRDERLRATELKARLAGAELQALKMQLQPHFLFNALNSISALTLEDPKSAVRMITRLGDFLRLTIESTGTQEVSLQEELEFLRCYLEIEQVRFQDRLQVVYETEPMALTARVPNLILQPLVENAIKHGIASTLSAGRIVLRAQLLPDQLRVQVENDGAPGSCPPGSREGLGLHNTRERLRQCYGASFELTLERRPEGGAVTTLLIPYRAIGGAAAA
jgi:sensor histidine kinase YesM